MSESAPSLDKTTAHRTVGRRGALIGIAVVGACGLLLTAWFALCSSASERALPGVKLGELDVSRLSRAQIEAQVQGFTEQRAVQQLSLRVGEAQLELVPKNLGFTIDARAAAARALRVGREGGLLGRYFAFIGRALHAESAPLDARFDAALLTATFDEWEASALRDAPFAGGIAVDGVAVAPVYPRAGRRIERKRAAEQLRASVLAGKASEPLATHVESPKLDRAAVDRVVVEAQAMLAAEVRLTTADGARELRVSPRELGSVLRTQPNPQASALELTCAPDSVESLIAPQRAALEIQPVDARIAIDAQDHVRVEPGHPGQILPKDALASALCAAARSAEHTGALPLVPGAEPALTTAAAEQAGIVGLMGTYTTRHVCCQPRVDNIHHIADLLDGTLVKPGETFSVNAKVGPRTQKNGFKPAPTIEDGDMIDTVGGGVSQFATTLFNALFYGGYDIIERQPHSYWFTRYPMGYDATLSYPHPDIVFKNDTEAGALIKTQYTDTTITVKIYGNNGGRRVRAEVSPKQNIVLPPVEFIPNPRLEPDEEKTREGGMIGWTVVVKRTITFPDGKLKEEKRKVTYRPRARRVAVHPCRIPAGEPGHTGERCPVVEKSDETEGSAPTDGSAK